MRRRKAVSYFGTIYTEDIPHRAKSVYMYFRDRTNASGTCWPGIKKIATDLHLSRSTVKRALEDLSKAGLIKRSDKSIAVSRPKWGDFDDDWNIQLMDTDANGYSLRITDGFLKDKRTG